MLGENIRELRKARGYSQETLAQELNVVRQTVSKWEKGLSVPDADMLEKLAAVFEVSADALLGKSAGAEKADENEIARQLAILNEQLARQHRGRRRIWKIVGIVLLSAALLWVISCILAFSAFTVYTDSGTVTTYEETIEIAE